MPVTIDDTHCVNSLGMPIDIYDMKLHGLTIGEFRNEKWATIFKQAVEARRKTIKPPVCLMCQGKGCNECDNQGAVGATYYDGPHTPPNCPHCVCDDYS